MAAGPVEHHCTTFVAERSVGAIERAAVEQRRFFTWAGFQDPHPGRPDFGAWPECPFTNHGCHSHLIAEADLRRNVATYYGMISVIDAGSA
jgi:hypothetical protein